MKQTESDRSAARAFLNDKPYKRGNTEVTQDGYESVMKCQNEIIAWKSIGDLRINLTSPEKTGKQIIRKLNAIVQVCTGTKLLSVVSHQRKAYFRANFSHINEKDKLYPLKTGTTITDAAVHYNTITQQQQLDNANVR